MPSKATLKLRSEVYGIPEEEHEEYDEDQEDEV
jgi:hypothetical protein